MKKLLYLPLSRQPGKSQDQTPTKPEQIPIPSHPPSTPEKSSSIFQPLPSPNSTPIADLPVNANFSPRHLVVAGGVAIFHLASARVVLCRHSVHNFWFLPKGRRDAGEETGAGAEREGFEESGYRNRLLPIPLKTLQPRAHNPSGDVDGAFVTDQIWTQFAAQTARRQYVLFWFIAETISPEVEEAMNEAMSSEGTLENPTPYLNPPKYPRDLTLAERVKLEPEGYEPVHHQHTGVNADEALYEAYLLPVGEAVERLRGSVQEEVVRLGWGAICERWRMEKSCT